MYTIISKIDKDNNGNIRYTDVGYTTNQTLINQININFDETLGVFFASNRTKLELGEIGIDTFFSGTTYVNEARIIKNTLEGTDLVEITDINQL